MDFVWIAVIVAMWAAMAALVAGLARLEPTKGGRS